MKKILLFLAWMCLVTNLFGVYSEDFPITVKQPDGTELICYITGDEYYNWLHDADGYTIVRDPETGYLVYAQLENDVLVATKQVVGIDNPKEAGLTPWTIISAQKRAELRRTFLENTPEKPVLKTPDSQKSRNQTINNIVIYIRFFWGGEYEKDTMHYWTMFNSMEEQNTPSMRNYFQQMSYNKADIVSYFYPISLTDSVISYRNPHTRQYYMPYDSVTNFDGYRDFYERMEREHTLLHNAIEYVKDQIPTDLDLDFNNDGYVDNVCFIIKGEPTAWNTLLWPHKWSLYSVDPTYLNGCQVWDYNLLIESHLDIHQSSVISHETYHTLGAPDLYRYTDRTIAPVGKWDIMASNTYPPQSTAAYMKHKYGAWIDDIPVITSSGVYTIYPVWHDTKTVYKILSPNSNDEFFTVEFRDNNIFWDQNLSGSGLIIYRIKPDLWGNSEGPPDEIYVFRPDEDYPNEDGRINDAFFSADVGRTEFTATSNPACLLSNGASGGIEIRNISAVGDSMTFEVKFAMKPKADFNSDIQAVHIGSQVRFYDLSSNNPTKWAWQFEGGTPATSAERNPVIRYETAGTYPVKLTASNEYGSDVITKNNYIKVGTTPVADFEADKTDIQILESIKFKDLSLNNPTKWKWNFEGGLPATSSERNPTISYPNEGKYAVSLTVTNEFGSDVKEINSYIVVSPISINEIDENQIAVYPNPNTIGIFTLENEGIPLGSVIQMYDMTGREIMTRTMDQKNMTIDLSAYPSGAYFLRIINGDIFYNAKLIKQ
ncbi:MAG: PKD domain-containing protein [Bacteroidales bacterium]|jgi:M6 family metalloprotease-like protein|nr:PKD domain-containing protein [Bacteroidales bacterium]